MGLASAMKAWAHRIVEELQAQTHSVTSQKVCITIRKQKNIVKNSWTVVV